MEKGTRTDAEIRAIVDGWIAEMIRVSKRPSGQGQEMNEVDIDNIIFCVLHIFRQNNPEGYRRMMGRISDRWFNEFGAEETAQRIN